VPEEFQFAVSDKESPVVTGAAGADAMRLYTLPNSAAFQLSLPNPGACGTDPLGCLPDTAISCNPAFGCQPRLATINYNAGGDKLVGLFDLETKAFAALATTGGHTRVLLSGGTDLDATVQGLLGQLNAMAAQLGIDLPALLGTPLDLNIRRPDGSTDVIRISVLRLIEIFNVPNGPATGLGLQLPLSAGAGVITHLGEWISTPAPVNPALHDENGDQSGYGYTVTEASALPAIPSLPAPLNLLLPPGKIMHVEGNIPEGSGGHMVAIGATTDPDPSTGLPVSIPPASTLRLVPDNGIDFVGVATVVTGEVCLGPLGCLGGALLIGTGVATFGPNPLPGFGSIPFIWGDELGLGAVMAPVDALVADIAGELLSNPAVADLTGSLPIGGLLGGDTEGGSPLGGLPLGDLPLAALLGGLPLGQLPVGQLPVGQLPGGAILGNLTNLLQLF
jgi:hypothetical protein